MRKLVTFRTINEIKVHENADLLELAIVDGWQCVVRKGEFKAGDKVFYFEIDSVLPVRDEFEFLRKSSFIEREWVVGFRLKTMRLRGEYSQGLLVPAKNIIKSFGIEDPQEGVDYSEQIGVIKWDPPLNACLAGEAIGNFPSEIPKTDEERIQNLKSNFREYSKNQQEFWEVTEKLDGSSMTVFMTEKEGEKVFGVASRNLNLREIEGNTLWKVAREKNLEEKLIKVGRNLALQGEICGPGIQKNSLKLNYPEFYLYKVWDIDEKRYLEAHERRSLAAQLGIEHVPVLDEKKSLYGLSVEDLIRDADGDSQFGVGIKREGLVYKSGQKSFKVISNKWLLKNE